MATATAGKLILTARLQFFTTPLIHATSIFLIFIKPSQHKMQQAFKANTLAGEQDLDTLLKTMKPQLNEGGFVFCTVNEITHLNPADIILSFKEQEGITIIISKVLADKLQLGYSFVTAWITLTVHSSLEAVGLTAAFSKALADNGISCNVVAAYYHDHIFVDKKDAEKAMDILNWFSS
jgi:uncharacterized protein